MGGKWAKLAAIAIALVFIVVGCRPATPQPTTPLPTPGAATTAFPTGTFTMGDWKCEIRADGSYRTYQPMASETGTYTVTGNQVVLIASGGSCRAKGTYTWTFDGKALSFKALDDPCTKRRMLDGSKWLKQP